MTWNDMLARIEAAWPAVGWNEVLLAVAAGVLTIVVIKAGLGLVVRRLKALSARTSTTLDDALVSVLERTNGALIVLVGLACKNAILIVEFAREAEIEGMNRVDAVLEAARLRLRPILMTSFAFIMGVFPLAISSGAGANSRHAIGTGVIGGMVTATILAIFWVPLFYVVVSTLFKDKQSKEQEAIEKGH